MSYPPPPGQDPNNPYSAPPQGQPPPPGYGYPQQGQGLPAYGGPQGYPQGGAGYPGPPATMPGTINAVRIILYILGGLGVVGSLFIFLAAFAMKDALDDAASTSTDPNTEMLADLGTGVIAGIGVLTLALAVFAIVLAAKVAGGGNGVRIGVIVYGALAIIGGLFSFPIGIIHIALGILLIVFVAKQDGSAWFNRPRH